MDARNTSQVFKVRRAFRGSVLWLTHYESRPLSMQWSTRDGAHDAVQYIQHCLDDMGAQS